MPDTLLDSPPPAGADHSATDVTEWLAGLLHAALDREDAPLAHT